jgi:hypothetical protein
MVWTPFVGIHIRNSGLSVDRGQVQIIALACNLDELAAVFLEEA